MKNKKKNSAKRKSTMLLGYYWQYEDETIKKGLKEFELETLNTLWGSKSEAIIDALEVKRDKKSNRTHKVYKVEITEVTLPGR